MTYLIVFNVIFSLGLAIALWRYRKRETREIHRRNAYEASLSDLHQKIEIQNKALKDLYEEHSMLSEFDYDLNVRLVRLELKQIVHYETVQ